MSASNRRGKTISSVSGANHENGGNVQYRIEAVVLTNIECTEEEAIAAAQAIRQSLEMVAVAVPFVDSVGTDLKDVEGNLVNTSEG